MKGTCAVAVLSALMLSACAGGAPMSASSPTPSISSSPSPNYSMPGPASPGRTQGGGEGGNGGQGGQNGQGTAGPGGK